MNYLTYLKCSIGICLLWGIDQGFTADAYVIVSSTNAMAAAGDFLKTFRPDIACSPQKDFTVVTDSTDIVLRFSITKGREGTIRIDRNRGEMGSFSAFRGYSLKQYSENKAKIREQDIAGLRDNVISKLGISTNNLKLAFGNRYRLHAKSKQELITYLWQRQIRGFPFKDDYVTTTFDTQDGELLAVKKKWGALPTSLQIKVNLPEAKQMATKLLLNKNVTNQLEVTSANVWVVTCKSGTRRLAWVLEVPKQSGIDNYVEVWVSTETGRILGEQNAIGL